MQAMQRAEAYSEVMGLHIADKHVEAKALADKWGFDIYDDEGTNEGNENV